MPSLYYGFDLDHTLGDFKYIDKYLDFFYMETKVGVTLSNKLTHGYAFFIDEVVKHIRSGELHMFNPEILDTIMSLKSDFENGIATALIYSNNTHYETLVFAKDVIEKYVGTEIFCYLMDWNHDFRVNEIDKQEPGSANKTWDVLYKGFNTGCGDTPTPDQVVFYDDMSHTNLIEVLGPTNYKLIKPYTSVLNEESVEILTKSIISSLKSSSLYNNSQYYSALSHTLGLHIDKNNLDLLLDNLETAIIIYSIKKGGKSKNKKRKNTRRSTIKKKKDS